MRFVPSRHSLPFFYAAFLALLLLGVVAPGARAQQANRYARAPTSARYETAIRQSQALLQALRGEEHIPGLTAAVAVEGRIVWSEGFGYADVENRVPVWPHTKMRIGSISKPLTSVALGKLYEAGKLRFDASIRRYVPYFPEKRYTITVRQVAGHIAGIRHYREGEFLSKKHYDSVREGLTIFMDDSLLFKPGTQYSYSSYGWNLLSAVVEGASGQDFLRYMREEVFRPMGLRHTVADHVDSLIYHRTSYYRLNEEGQIRNAPYVDNSYKWAGGGFLSTAEDLVRFGSAMISGDFLEPTTVALLFTSQRLASGEKTGYGIGWDVDTDAQGRRVVGHSGGSVGGTTQLLIYPEEEIVVALICNLSDADYHDAEEKIAGFFLEAASQSRAGRAVPVREK